jgi:hypothetical protein
MELINATRMTAGYNVGLEPSGRELLVVVIKGTFGIPQSEGEPFALSDSQLPLVMADVFTGEPGVSAPLYEVDFAPRKPRCEILFNGSAYAPGGRPATRVEVAIQIGNWSKRLAVIGPRQWDCSVASVRATSPRSFVSQPISYDVAFGGSDCHHEDPAQHAAYMLNPVGRGFHKHLKKAWVDSKPLPFTEEVGRSVTDTNGDYRPMAFGSIGRNWEPRFRLAGTYDADWLEHHFPFLPPDFDARYFQAAPADQQVPSGFFDGGAEVVLTNLTPQGLTRFRIPSLRAPVSIFPKDGPRENHVATLDTVLIEPDQQRFSLTWRLARPLRLNMFEIARVQVGKKGREFWQRGEEIAFSVPVGPAALGA